ncbi:MAG: hypothetical protein PHT69_08350 [Bacteroidales bacterium]|nr:hypothetical protein [Bacteroidales bacterium]
MKYLHILLSAIVLLVLSAFMSHAQIPQGINFQATARDNTGNVIPNTTAQIRLSIVDSSAGQTVYQEQRTVITSNNGTFSFVVGQPPYTVLAGAFDNINWQYGHLYLRIDFDPANNSGFSLPPQFISFSALPFAFVTENITFINPDGAENGDVLKYNAATGAFEPGHQSMNAGQGISINGSTISNTGDASPLNEIQTIHISGDTLFISNGNFVRLPYAFPATFAAPSVTTLPATDIQQYSAKLMGKVNPRGLTTYTQFEWGTTPAFGETINALPLSTDGFNDVFVSASIVIESGTTYYYRLKGNNAAGIASGDALSFTTTLSPPHVTTQSITGIDTSMATAGGQITHEGGAPVTDKGLCWSTSPNPLATGAHVSCGAGSSPFNALIQGLAPATTYYLRAYAINIAGTSYGNEVVFTTLPIKPLVLTLPITSVTTSTALGGGHVTSNGGAPILKRGICWALHTTPDINDFISSDSTGTGIYQSTADGMLTGRTYYARAYATNAAGTTYGNEISFNTDTVTVGDFYQGGIVAYLYEPGDPGYITGEFHGLICTPFDLGNLPWGCYGTNLPGCEGSLLGTGAQNTAEIVAACPDTTTAAYTCAHLILNEYTDWHLPSLNEVSKLYSLWTMGAIGYYYLSSTESDAHFVYGYYMSGMWAVSYIKDNIVAVRAVRYF